MRPVSDAFLETLRGSHRMVARAKVVTGFPTGVNPDGEPVPILDGDVVFDASAKIRSTLDLTVPGTYWPDTPDALLAPYGNELFIERGIVVAGGSATWVSQGYFRIETPEQDEAPDGVVRVAAKDRMAGIIDARLEAPIQFLPNTSVQTVFNTLVLDVYPTATIEFDFDAAATTFPGNHVCERDRYEFLAEIVKALGKIWHWDYRGVLVVRDAPSPASPVWEVNAGRRGVLVSMGRERTREGVYNAYVAQGEAPGTDTVVRAVARDLTPSSPTRWGGPFGKVPAFFSSPFITTQGQAAAAAAAMLRRQVGLPYSVNFASVPNPALEPLDPVRLVYSPRKRAEVHVLDRITIPLTADRALTASTRDQSGLDVEVDLT